MPHFGSLSSQINAILVHCCGPPCIQGRELVRFTVSSSSLAAACVWQLLVLPDGTVVSGDSEGAVQFWDGRFGTLLQVGHFFLRRAV